MWREDGKGVCRLSDDHRVRSPEVWGKFPVLYQVAPRLQEAYMRSFIIAVALDLYIIDAVRADSSKVIGEAAKSASI